MGTDCPFCRIADGDDRAHYLHRGERTAAFLDDAPAAWGHTLVVPTEHVTGLVDVDGATTAALFETVRGVAAAIDRALGPDGFSVFHTTGPLVGSVEHAHVHVIPRRADDAIHVGLERTELADEAAERLVDRVRVDL